LGVITLINTYVMSGTKKNNNYAFSKYEENTIGIISNLIVKVTFMIYYKLTYMYAYGYYHMKSISF